MHYQGNPKLHFLLSTLLRISTNYDGQMLITMAYQENLRLGLLLMLMDWCCDGIGDWRRRSTGSVDLNLIRMIKWDLLVLTGIVVHSTGSHR